jgi:hypothetical protein
VVKIKALSSRFDVQQYGELSYDKAGRYPLFCLKSKNWDASKPNVLITGGVHGYETSGVQGALMFLDKKAESYSSKFNILCCPCVSPWGYETIQVTALLITLILLTLQTLLTLLIFLTILLLRTLLSLLTLLTLSPY